MSIGTGFGRLYRGETTVDYYGKRKPAFVVSVAFLVVSIGGWILAAEQHFHQARDLPN